MSTVRAVVVITDSEAVKDFERAFLEDGSRGFTIVPTVYGAGRSGLKAGDRVHPGASSLLFTVVEDDQLPPTLEFVRAVRDRSGAADATKIYWGGVETLPDGA